MSEITEIYYDVITKRLRKHHYTRLDMHEKTEPFREKKGNSTLLLERIREQERAEKEMKVQKEPSPELRENTPKPEIPEKKKKKNKADKEKSEKKRLFRNLNKKKFSIFEDYEDEQAIRKKEIDELINQDGFYSEIKPVDDGISYSKRRDFNGKPIVLVIGLLILSTVFLIVQIGGILK